MFIVNSEETMGTGGVPCTTVGQGNPRHSLAPTFSVRVCNETIITFRL